MNRERFPGILWLLPIFFGLTGGILAGFISSLKYQDSWWELVLAGFVVSCLAVVAYLLLMQELIASMW